MPISAKQVWTRAVSFLASDATGILRSHGHQHSCIAKDHDAITPSTHRASLLCSSIHPSTHLASLCSSSFRQDTMPDCFSTAKESVDSGFPPVSSARRNVLKVQSSTRDSLERTCRDRREQRQLAGEGDERVQCCSDIYTDLSETRLRLHASPKPISCVLSNRRCTMGPCGHHESQSLMPCPAAPHPPHRASAS